MKKVRLFAIFVFLAMIIAFANTGSADAAVTNPGDLDPTFDGDGIAYAGTVSSGYDQAQSIAVQAGATQPDSKLVVVGYAESLSEGSNFALARYNDDGSLDTSFDDDGIVSTDLGFSGNDYAYSVAIQDDGKIVVAGYASYLNSYRPQFAIARYNSDGSLDASFDGDGIVLTSVGGNSDIAYSVAIQADGKIVAAGQAYGSATFWQTRFAVVRYNSDGSLDTSFDGDGVVLTSIGGNSDTAKAVAIQADGKIVAAGRAHGLSTDYYYHFAVVRYNSDGSLDTSFDSDGMAIVNVSGTNASSWGSDYANAVAIQADGRIVAAGHAYGPVTGYSTRWAVARLNVDGSLDSSFDGDGTVITDVGGSFGNANAVAIQADGQIVTAGYGYGVDTGYQAQFGVARYNGDGTLDTSFDSDGIVTTNLGGNYAYAYGVAIQADGKIAVAGSSSDGVQNDFGVARYNNDGSLDTSFDADGIATTNIGLRLEDVNGASDMALQSDGKIVTVGSFENQFLVSRLNGDGSMDASFGSNGIVMTDVGASFGYDGARAVAIQSDDKIVVSGYTYDSSYYQAQFATVRYNGDGSLDTSFDGDGIVLTSVGGSYDVAHDVAIEANGKIVVVGQASGSATGNVSQFGIVRYNDDGSLDTSFDGDGKAISSLADGWASASAVAIQADGKILATGRWCLNYCEFATMRFDSNGGLDTSFDGDGLVTTGFAYYSNYAEDVAVQADGKIVVAGWVCQYYCEASVVRYNSDGSLDTTFDGDGIVNTDFGQYYGGRAFAVAIQADSKIVVVGQACPYYCYAGVARYNSDGSLDASFDSDGIVTIDFGQYYGGRAYAVAIQTDNKIVIAGAACPYYCSKLVVARFGTVANQPPTADAGGPYNGSEGAAIALSNATASDPDLDALTYSWGVSDALLCSFDDASLLNPSLTCNDNGSFTVTLEVSDGTESVSSDATVTVINVDPTVGLVSVPPEPVDINAQPVTGVSAPFTDPGTADSHTCTVDYDDGSEPLAGTVDAGTCTGPDHTYVEAGVYEVTVEVTDDDSGVGSATATSFIVIYDPSAGFVTGGGWIMSPEGACQFDVCTDGTVGKANFGFVSRYKKGANAPTGQTEFQFKAGELNFHSSVYDWLVVAGQDRAKYKGEGTINGGGNYGFMLTATDNGNAGDTFRIKIWDIDNGNVVVYDNQLGADDAEFDGTVIGGGNIKVHSK